MSCYYEVIRACNHKKNSISHFSLYFTASNLLFVESPAGVGWSYSNTTTDYTCGDDSTGKRSSIYLVFWASRPI